MKKVLFDSRLDLEKRKKVFSIHSRTEDKECRVNVHKSFTYVVGMAKDGQTKPRVPVVFIHKECDTRKGIEEFSFHVKGFFFITHNETLMKVRFYHTLDIKIDWKSNDFSPKKSESLT